MTPESRNIILFNKPYGVLSQFSKSSDEEKTLANYIPFPHYYPAGRLDKKSEGLILLTNDGALQHKLTNPCFKKDKHYWVQIEGIPTEIDLLPIRQGLSLEKIYYQPARVNIIPEPTLWIREPPIRIRQAIPTSWLHIILQEGKNHQIRHMTAAIRFPTLRLVRIQIGAWKLDDLRPGEYRIIE